MRRPLASLPLLALAAGLALAGCDELFPHRSPGEQLFRDKCAECHGYDGAGNTPRFMGDPWADLTDDEWKEGGSDVEVETAVREGVFGKMPAFPNLTARQMRELLAYLRTLRHETSDGSDR